MPTRLARRSSLSLSAAALVLAALTPTAHCAQPAAQASFQATPSAVTCTSARTKLTARKVAHRPDHLLITATNTGHRTCYAYHAPYLRFEDAQAPVAFLERSVPQAVVTLDPGQSAYAAVRTSAADGSGECGRTVHRLDVLFANRAADGSAGSPAQVPLPSGGVYVDSGATVTYWQSSKTEALAY